MRPTDAQPVDHLTLVDLVRLDMQRYGARFVRAEFAGGTLLVALPALAVLAVVVTRPQMAPIGQLLLLAIGVILAGWLLNGLTLLAIACRQDVGPSTPDDPGRTHRAVARLVRLLLIPGSLPLIALWQVRRHARAAQPAVASHVSHYGPRHWRGRLGAAREPRRPPHVEGYGMLRHG